MDKETALKQLKIKNYWLLNGDPEMKSFEEKLQDLLDFEEWLVSKNILTWNEIDAAESKAA